MIHWPSYLYIYPSWTDILAYYTDRITDVTSLPLRRVLRPRKPTLRDLARIVCLWTKIPIAPCSLCTPRGSHASKSSGDVAILVASSRLSHKLSATQTKCVPNLGLEPPTSECTTHFAPMKHPAVTRQCPFNHKLHACPTSKPDPQHSPAGLYGYPHRATTPIALRNL
jgi:hypothetical protein